MKKSTVVILIGGYTIIAGILTAMIGYTPVEVAGHVLIGVGLANVIRGIEMLIRE